MPSTQDPALGVIGLLGGMSWESTALYYRNINTGISRALGGMASAPIILCSLDFREVETSMRRGDWAAVEAVLVDRALKIQAAGAGCLLICTNTMHRLAPAVERALSIPLLHIADAAAEEVLAAGFKTVGLIGTLTTMEGTFFTERLQARGISTLVPGPEDRAEIHRVIFEELCRGAFLDTSLRRFLQAIDDLRRRGAQAVILGCTEIVLLVDHSMTDLPLLDTTAIHSQAAADWSLSRAGITPALRT